MRSLIICASIFLFLQQVLANRYFIFKDLSSSESSECSSSSHSSFSSSSSSCSTYSSPSDSSDSSCSSPSSSDSSSSSSCDDSSYKTIPPSMIPIPYLAEKILYDNKDVNINLKEKIPLFYQLRSKALLSKDLSDSSFTSPSFSSSSFSFDWSSTCEDSSDGSSDSSCSSSLPSGSSLSSSWEDSTDESSDSSWSSSSSSDSSSSSSSEDSSDESSDSSWSSSSSSDSSSSSSSEDSSDESSDSSSSSSSSPSDSNSSSNHEDSSDKVVPLEPCPPGKSLHAKEDVIAMIDYTANTLSIYQSINNSYYTGALAVHDKYMNDFKQFRSRFQNRPEHLKYVIEDLADKRLNIESSVEKVAQVLHEYSHLEQEFTERLESTNTLLMKLKRYRTVCKHNCDIEHLSGLRTSNGQDGYICSSLEDLHRDISSKLKLFETKMKVTLQDKVANDDNVFNDKINILKNNLKDVALREFRGTMYDVLNLQDEYDNFMKYMTRVNPASYLNNIKQTILNIDAKLFEFEKEIEDYGKYCRSCRAYGPWALRQNAGVSSKHKKIKNNNILSDLLNQKFTNIESSINEDYANIFQDLNALLNNTDIEDVFVKELKPIQNDIIEMLQKERVKFNEIKNIAPQSSIEKLINLSKSSRKLLSNITKEINILKES